MAGFFRTASSSLCCQRSPFGFAVELDVEAVVVSAVLVVVWIMVVIVRPVCGLLRAFLFV